MAEEGFKRKLAAILSADVAGYSRLMAEDETFTVKTIATYREVMRLLIKQHRGRVVDSPGDNVLAEFSSVVDAVQCAVAVQNEVQTRNAELPDNRRMEFRIGINLGDVIDEEGRIYGDGVNITARLEALADPGGICVSKTAFDQIETKLPLAYEYLGEQSVKNIPKPVGAYRVLMQPRVTVAGEKEKAKPPNMRRKTIIVAAVAVFIAAVAVGIWQFYLRRGPSVELALGEKPSIAVLPFDNLSGDAEQEYFADGMTEELITNLSKLSGLLIISCNSSFTYKGKPTKIQQVAKELDVRYVLEGSVQRAGERVRIRAQLIDGATDHHLWAESYEAEMENIFDLQDKITRKIASALSVKLTGEEQARFGTKETDNLEAYEALLKGREHLGQATPDGYAKALSYYKLATELDPNYSRAHAKLADLYILGTLGVFPYEWRAKIGVQFQRARLLARKHLEIAMSKPTATAHVVASTMALIRRRFDEAKAHAERALSMDPNDPDAYRVMAELLLYTGRPKEAFEFVEKSMRLDSHDISFDLDTMATAHLCLGEYEKAITVAKKAIARYPDVFVYWWGLAISYAHLGRIQEAKSAYEKNLTLWEGGFKPDLALQMLYVPFKSAECADICAGGLIKAGCPGQPSGYYKIYAENRLSGKEVRELISGHKLNLFYGNYPFSIDHSEDGIIKVESPRLSYGGAWWIKEAMVCYRFERPDWLGLDDCGDTYRNPDSMSGSKEEYFTVRDHGIFTFSVAK